MQYRWKIVLLFLFLQSGLALQRADAQIQLLCIPDTNRMLLGDQQKIKLSITADKAIRDIQVHLDSISKVQGFEIIRQEDWVESETAGSKILTKDIVFTAFNPGTFTFPGIAYTYEYNGMRDTGYSKAFTLTVFPVETKTKDLQKNKEILTESKNLYDYLWWIIAIAGLLLLFAGIIYYIRRRKQLQENRLPGLPPMQIALEQLGKLRENKLWASGEHKKYQFALTDIIRQYLNAQFGMRYSFTTSRILMQLRQWKWPALWVQIIDESFRIADLVKFAKAESQPEINLSYIDKLEEMVKATSADDFIEPKNAKS